jgi:hypothetical protein
LLYISNVLQAVLVRYAWCFVHKNAVNHQSSFRPCRILLDIPCHCFKWSFAVRCGSVSNAANISVFVQPGNLSNPIRIWQLASARPASGIDYDDKAIRWILFDSAKTVSLMTTSFLSKGCDARFVQGVPSSCDGVYVKRYYYRRPSYHFASSIMEFKDEHWENLGSEGRKRM